MNNNKLLSGLCGVEMEFLREKEETKKNKKNKREKKQVE